MESKVAALFDKIQKLAPYAGYKNPECSITTTTPQEWTTTIYRESESIDPEYGSRYGKASTPEESMKIIYDFLHRKAAEKASVLISESDKIRNLLNSQDALS